MMLLALATMMCSPVTLSTVSLDIATCRSPGFAQDTYGTGPQPRLFCFEHSDLPGTVTVRLLDPACAALRTGDLFVLFDGIAMP